MYKVMIVDDELPGREILKHLINWDNTNFSVSSTAKHGKDAIQQYDIIKPNLIITDIQMPIMDGLELIEKIKEMNNEQEFIILSCYEDFSYAQKAIRLGVTDYLIKGLVTEDDLYAVLCKVEERLQYKKPVFKDNSNIIIRPFEKDQQRLGILFFEKLNCDSIRNIIDELHLNICGDNFVIMVVSIDRYKQLINDKQLEYNKVCLIKSIIQYTIDLFSGGECLYSGDGNFIIITPVKSINSQMKFINECMVISNHIRNEIIGRINQTISIAVSDRFRNLEEIYQKTKEALDLLEFRVFTGYNKTILFNTYLQRIQNVNPQIIKSSLEEIKTALNNSNFDEMKKLISRVLRENIKGFMQLYYLKYVNSCLLDTIIVFANRNSLSYRDIFNCDFIPIDKINMLETIDEIIEWYEIIINNIRNTCSNKEIVTSNSIIKEVVQFIEQQYCQGTISLDSIASYANLHKVYLCRLFKQETNMTISNYVISLKLKKAQSLLKNSSLKISEVSKLSGFASPSKFNSVFKKKTGLTPTKFRKS